MKDQEEIQNIFEDKYENKLGITFGEWMEQMPQTEDQAYTRLNDIDAELNSTYDEWFEAQGQEKEELEEYRDRLKSEYDLLEEIFGLESGDKSW